jgi:hypothetical protein
MYIYCNDIYGRTNYVGNKEQKVAKAILVAGRRLCVSLTIHTKFPKQSSDGKVSLRGCKSHHC